jgi:hypothetical protein
MYTTRSNLQVIIAGFVLLLFSTSASHASLVSFSVTGDPYFVAAGNPFGLTACGTCTESISADGVYDDSGLDGVGTEFVYFGSGSGNSITAHVGTIDFLETMDVDYAGGFDPFLEFQDGNLASINLLFTTGTNGATADFSSSGILFGSGSVLSGIWDAGSFSTTPVPMPAAVWLFGSGLIGLVGVARRKRNRV